jgi:hypothetical protein
MQTSAEVAEPTEGNLPPVVVRPRSPMFTSVGTWLVRLSLPWLLVSLLAMDAALTAMGMLPARDSILLVVLAGLLLLGAIGAVLLLTRL